MWPIVFSTSIFLTVIYCLLIFIYRRWFNRLDYFKSSSTGVYNRFSIVVPARNEEDNIEKCIKSILENDYPTDKYEIIAADDFSEDNTSAIVTRMQRAHANLKLIQLKDVIEEPLNSYKKKAIETAISQASYEWIITTDADCIMTRQWLSLYNEFINTHEHLSFITAPVKFINTGSFLSVFQCLDFISLQGITAASVSAGFVSMCNGANLAYKKETFYAVGGFKDVDNIASGDDMLLMHKIQKKFPGRTGYLFHPQAIVATLPMPDCKSFINQRIRWASKATYYKDKKIFFLLLLVYVFNLCLLILPFFAFLDLSYLYLWLALLFIKTACELFFMKPVADFFGQKKLLKWFAVMQPLHLIYIVISGWLGTFGKYEWKKRIIK